MPRATPSTSGVAASVFRGIYDEHFPFVWKSLRRLGVREADVPDAVQEVFLVVHRKLDTFEGRSKMTTWLFGIAFRVARDRQRSAAERRHVTDDAAIDASADESVDVHADAERRQARDVLETILDAMSLEQRAAFTLFELEGMSTAEIAEICGIPLGTVYTRLRLAREVFQEHTARLKARAEFQERASASPPGGARARTAGAAR
ncbi:MAG: sigma-70 family RNA polymerase sigma factor [Polyangiaceae bacterium]